ncbi:unnamed protein product [Urochloa humidicola]
MDPNSSYVLKLRHLANPENARKDVTCYYFEKDIHRDKTNFMDFVNSIVNRFPPGYMEVAHVQYYDDVSGTSPEVKTDQELMAMFDKYIETKVVHMFIIYSHPSKEFQPLTEWEYDDLSQLSQSMQKETTQSGDDYLQNPFPENEIVGVDEEVMY